MQKYNGYVLYGVEYLRDSREEFVRYFRNLADVLDYLNSGGFIHNYDFHLFAVREEIPLTEEKIEISQPSKIVKRYKVKE